MTSTTNTTPPRAPDAIDDQGAANVQRAIAEGLEATGMQETYDAIEEALGPRDVKSWLLRARLGAEPLHLDGAPGPLMIRGLSQDEVKRLKAEANGDDVLFEHLLVAEALIEPKMTPDEIATFFRVAPAGDALDVMSTVQRLSKMNKGAAKSVVPEVRE